MTNSSPAQPDVEAFLRRYEAVGRSADLAPLHDLFAPSFVVGSPAGAVPVNVEMVVAAATARRARLLELGHDGGRLVSQESTWLGSSCWLARTTWELDFLPPGRDPVTLTAASDFLLHLGPDGLRIVTYVVHQDLDAEVAALVG